MRKVWTQCFRSTQDYDNQFNTQVLGSNGVAQIYGSNGYDQCYSEDV